MAVASDRNWLASGGDDGTVRIWDVANSQEQAILKVDAHNTVTALALAPNGSWLASGGKGGIVRVWDVASGKQTAAMKADVAMQGDIAG
jgi:WD40 repeat protein